jgi:pimeloyl-ACP methyl ester carboxylesterase
MGDSGYLAPLILASAWDVISHNWALSSILLTVVLLIVIPSLVLLKYVRICLNIISDTEPPLSMTQLGFDRMYGEEKDFYATDGVRLRGIFMHPPPGILRRGTIIFAPEFKSDRHSCARYCRPLIAAGYDVFSFDFRGHGQSSHEEGYTPRQWASEREIADMMGAIGYVEQWLEDMHRPVEIGLFGISRGACAAVLCGAACTSVKAIVTDGAFSSDCTLEHLMKRWAKIFAKVRIVYENHPPEFWQFLRWCLFVTCRVKFKCTFPSVKKTLTQMQPRPMLLIHSERDSYIPVEQSRLLYALAAQPKYLWVVPGAKHNQSVDVAPQEYARRTVQFFDRYLAQFDCADNMYNENRFADIARSELAGPARRMPVSTVERHSTPQTVAVEADAASVN